MNLWFNNAHISHTHTHTRTTHTSHIPHTYHKHIYTHTPTTPPPPVTGQGQLTVGFSEADRTEEENVGSVTISLQKNNTNVGPLTVMVSPLTLQQFEALSFTLPPGEFDVFPLDGPDPAERKLYY